jgi:homoserine kinase type II
MAVYTVLGLQEIQALVAPLQIGQLLSAKGIAEGVENSNYMLAAKRDGNIDEYVLTIAESQSHADIVFIVELTTTLARQGLPVPAPLLGRDGTAILQVQGKPAVLVPKIAGEHPLQPNIDQCREIGRALGRFHQVTLAAGLRHQSLRSLDWVRATAHALSKKLPLAERTFLDAELAGLNRFVVTYSKLPQAIIHGDLFRDNTLFQGDRLGAIIDFFSAGTGFLMFDLAVVVNDWCAAPDGSLDPARTLALLREYNAERSPSDAEMAAWPEFLRIAALRFWVSRMAEALSRSSREEILGVQKDPQQYRNILSLRTKSPPLWPF